MSADDLTILCTGDLHLGRHPTRIPAELDGQSFSPKSVWRATVDLAIDREVDAVLISGDVVDRENRYLEAYGPFEEGATRLDTAEIPMVLVTGNHDFDVLPRLVADLDLDHLSLVGADETWERKSLPDDDNPRFHVDGWSFGHEHVHRSPLESYDHESAEIPVFGLLHAEYGVPESDYAPVERAALEATPVDAWVLGHIHAPGVLVEREPLVFYPGSPQPLDPGESGGHGPWTLEYSDTSGVTVEKTPQATIRYDGLTVDVSGIEDWKEVLSITREQIDEYVAEAVDTRALELLSVRLSITGRTDCHRDLIRQRRSIEEDLEFKRGALSVRVEEVDVDTQAAVDLEELAEDDTPAAHLAGLLLELERGEPSNGHVLLDAVTDAVQEAYSAGAYTPLRREGRITDPASEESVDLLRRQARLLLHELLEQPRADR